MYTDQVAKLQLADLFSKVGGILNLWAGITVVVILEVTEMMLRIAVHWVKERRKRREGVQPEAGGDDTQLRTMRDKQELAATNPANIDLKTMREKEKREGNKEGKVSALFQAWS